MHMSIKREKYQTALLVFVCLHVRVCVREKEREGGTKRERESTLYDHCESYRYEIHLSNDQPVQVSSRCSRTYLSVCKNQQDRK